MSPKLDPLEKETLWQLSEGMNSVHAEAGLS